MKIRSKFVSNSSSSSFIVNEEMDLDPLLILATKVTDRQDEVDLPFDEDENEN